MPLDDSIVPREVGEGDPEGLGTKVILTARQTAVVQLLQGRHDAPAKMYLGALRVLGDSDNADRLALAAHGVRELIEKLPEYFELPVPRRGVLRDKVQELVQPWEKARKKAEAGRPFPNSFVGRLDAFFTWFKTEFPTHKAKTAGMLRGLDPARRALPAPIERNRVEQWLELRGWFVERAHHKPCSDEELTERLGGFEEFLLELLRPRTFENADKLDELIREGERNG